MEPYSTMDSADIRHGVNSSGECIYGNTNELVMLKCAKLLTYLVTKIQVVFPNLTIDEYHTLLINSNPKMIDMLRKDTPWSDSFMIDQMNFQCGGDRRFVDYPQITQPYFGQLLRIEGVQHAITEYGLLTFKTQIVSDDEN